MKSSRPGPLAKSGLFRSSSFFAVDEADLVTEDTEDHDGAAIVDLQAALPPRDALMVLRLNVAPEVEDFWKRKRRFSQVHHPASNQSDLQIIPSR